MCNNANGCTTATLTNGFLGNTTFRSNAGARGHAGELLRREPRRARRREPRRPTSAARATTRCSSSSASACRTACRSTPATRGATRSSSSATACSGRPPRSCRPARSAASQHAWKANWIYELPFGHDQRWASNASGLKDALIGGWSIDGVARIQTGEMLDFGNVRAGRHDARTSSARRSTCASRRTASSSSCRTTSSRTPCARSR